ncbi:MAG: hypothetical protein VR65_15515 [Desulfobulbaceae bacterium BRH_c16a]|nr:MAG: hypothetical protein VR65_15515 [Desulfobulbaceae bacterium BRH_c16a]
MRILLMFCLLMIGLPANAQEIAGVMVQETILTDDGTTLHLNGAGIRTKVFFDIYIAELYMENPSASAAEVIAAEGRKRIIMHFLYKEVTKDKLVDAWNEGFKGNTGSEDLAGLQERIDRFNALFEDVKKNDVIVLDFAPSSGTTVTVKGMQKGEIPGKDFNDALLRIWLGDEPVTKSLKEQLLSYKK